MISVIVYQVGDKVIYTARGGTQSVCTITKGPYDDPTDPSGPKLYDATRDSDGLALTGKDQANVPTYGAFAPKW